MPIQEHLLSPDNPGSVNFQTLASSNALASSSTHSSLPSVPFLNTTVTMNCNNNGGPGTTRMGGQPSWNDIGDSTTSTPRQRRQWGPCGFDASRSEAQGGKRK